LKERLVEKNPVPIEVYTERRSILNAHITDEPKI